MGSLFSGGSSGSAPIDEKGVLPWDPATGKEVVNKPEGAWDPEKGAPLFIDPNPTPAHDPFYDLYPYLKPPPKQELPAIPQWTPPGNQTTSGAAGATTEVPKPTYKPKKTATILTTTKPGDLVPKPTGKKTLLGQ
jgi:hypothetical protein